MTRDSESRNMVPETTILGGKRRHMCHAETLIESGIGPIVLQERALQESRMIRKNMPADSIITEKVKLDSARIASVKALDADLVSRATAKDKEAYRQLVERYQSRAISIAYGILKNREDAEDVVQESFVKAYLSLPNFKGDSSFYTWLYRIVYNMSIDVKRKSARTSRYESDIEERELEHSMEGAAQSQDGPDEELIRKEKLRCIDKAMREISEEHRTVIMLREVDGLDYQEIADVTGVSKGTIMSRLHYARKKLQQVLERLFANELSSEGIDKRNG